jgi:hypothetical protein
MNIRTLRKHLPKTARVSRVDRKTVQVEAAGLTYRVGDEAGTNE